MNIQAVLAEIYDSLKTDLGPFLTPPVKDWTLGFKNAPNSLGATAMLIPAGGDVEQVSRHSYHKTIRAYLYFQMAQKPEMVKTLLKMTDDTLSFFDANPIIGGAQVQPVKWDVDTSEDGTSLGGLYFDLEIMTS
jgi:hypothetical protein